MDDNGGVGEGGVVGGDEVDREWNGKERAEDKKLSR